MVSTYDRRQPAYMNEGRLSRIKSGSTGTLYNQQSRMTNHNGYGGSRMQVNRDEDYIYSWCHHYGLTPATARALCINGIESTDDLLRLDRQTVSQLNIKDNEKILFRGALLQFKQSDYETARRQAAQGLRPHLLDKNHGISEEERRKRLELRTRIRRKKIQNNGGLSLADRILMQRREANSSLSEPTGGTYNLSLPSIDQSDMVSSRSTRSYYTDPIPRRTNSYNSVTSKTSDYSSGSGDFYGTPQKVVKKKKDQLKEADSSDEEEENVGKKKGKKKKKKQESDSEEEEEKPKKSKRKKDKVISESEDEDVEKEIKKKKKKKKKSKESETDDDEGTTKKKSKKKKDKHDKDDSDDDTKESKKKKKKDKKRKEEDESEEEEFKKEKKKKKKDKKRKEEDESEEEEIKREKKKKKKDKKRKEEDESEEEEIKREKTKKKKKDKDNEVSESEDEGRKHEKKKKKKKKKMERHDSDDD